MITVVAWISIVINFVLLFALFGGVMKVQSLERSNEMLRDALKERESE